MENTTGIDTVVHYGWLSDEQRWDANRYDWPWLGELGDDDKNIILLLDCLSDGEFSGQASITQFYNLIFKLRENGFDKDLLSDWGEVLAYANIITYEEFRHGVTLGKIFNYVKTGEDDFISNLSIRSFSEKYIWCFEERQYWSLYSYALAHLFAEIVNTELYKDVRSVISHPKLKAVVSNIMRDEARHIKAWKDIIKNIINADERHKQFFLESISEGLVYHNAMVHETFFEGQNKMLPLFLSGEDGKASAIERICKSKYSVLNELFGENNIYTIEDIKNIHSDFLIKSYGKKRAVYSKEVLNKIDFIG